MRTFFIAACGGRISIAFFFQSNRSGTSTYAASAYDYENEYCPHLWTVQSTSACSFRASEGGASEGFDSQNGNNCSAYYQCLAGGAAEQVWTSKTFRREIDGTRWSRTLILIPTRISSKIKKHQGT